MRVPRLPHVQRPRHARQIPPAAGHPRVVHPVRPPQYPPRLGVDDQLPRVTEPDIQRHPPRPPRLPSDRCEHQQLRFARLPPHAPGHRRLRPQHRVRPTHRRRPRHIHLHRRRHVRPVELHHVTSRIQMDRNRSRPDGNLPVTLAEPQVTPPQPVRLRPLQPELPIGIPNPQQPRVRPQERPRGRLRLVPRIHLRQPDPRRPLQHAVADLANGQVLRPHVDLHPRPGHRQQPTMPRLPHRDIEIRTGKARGNRGCHRFPRPLSPPRQPRRKPRPRQPSRHFHRPRILHPPGTGRRHRRPRQPPPLVQPEQQPLDLGIDVLRRPTDDGGRPADHRQQHPPKPGSLAHVRFITNPHRLENRISPPPVPPSPRKTRRGNSEARKTGEKQERESRLCAALEPASPVPVSRPPSLRISESPNLRVSVVQPRLPGHPEAGIGSFAGLLPGPSGLR